MLKDFFKTVLVLILITIAITSQNQKSLDKDLHEENHIEENQRSYFPFQRVIWTYWDSFDGETPLIVQICIDNIEKVAKKFDFKFILLNEQNIRSYVENYNEKFIQVRKRSIQRTAAHAADLLRILVIEQNGGIWVDSTSIFLNGLSELENIMSENYAHMIANRLSPQPDVLLFYYSSFQNRIEHFVTDPHNSSRQVLSNKYPNYEIWFIAAKKNAPLIQDVRKTYSKWTALEISKVEQKFINEDIYIHGTDQTGDYLYLNMAISFVLQTKQKQLDRNFTSLLGERKTSFEHYKLWGLHGEYGPMLTTRSDISPIPDLLEYSIQQIQQKGLKFNFFMKQFGFLRYVMGQKFQLMTEIYQKKNMTFEQFLESEPSRQFCQNVTWLVQGSIMDSMIRNSKVTEKHNFLTIKKEQNSIWHEYCWQRGSFGYKFHLIKQYTHLQTVTQSLVSPNTVHKAKVSSINNYKKEKTLWEWLKIKFDDNAFLLIEFLWLMMVIVLPLIITQKVFVWCFAKFIKKMSKKESLQQMVELNSYEQTEAQRDEIHRDKVFSSESSKLGVRETHSNKQRTLSILNLLTVIVTIALYNAVDILGGMDQEGTIFLVILFVFAIRVYLQRQIYSENSTRFVKQRQQYQLFYVMVNYMIAYLALCHVRKNRFWLNWYSMVLGMVGPCVIKLQRKIQKAYKVQQQKGWKQKQQTSSPNLSSFTLRSLFHFYPYSILTLLSLLLLNLLPNLQFITYNTQSTQYIISFVPCFLTIILCFYSLVLVIKCVTLKLYLQIIRLVLLVCLCIHDMVVLNGTIVVLNVHFRTYFMLRRVMFVAVIYQLIGWEIKFSNFEATFFGSFFRSIKLNWKIKKFIIFFGPLILECLYGKLFQSQKIMQKNNWKFVQHWVVLVFAVFLSVLTAHLQDLKQVYHSYGQQNFIPTNVKISHETSQ